MNEYKVGDTVRILDVRDLPDETGCGKVVDMKDYIGRIATIIESKDRQNLKLDCIPYWWAPNWLEPVSSASSQRLKVGQKGRVIDTTTNHYQIGDIVEYERIGGRYECRRLSDGLHQRLRLDHLEPCDNEKSIVGEALKASFHDAVAKTYGVQVRCIPVCLSSCDSKPRPGIRKEIRDRLLYL